MTLKSDLQVHIHHVHTKDKVLVLYDRLGINLRNHFNIIIIIIGITGYEPGAGGSVAAAGFPAVVGTVGRGDVDRLDVVAWGPSVLWTVVDLFL